MTPNFYLITVSGCKLLKNTSFFACSKMEGVVPPLRHEISKNGPRIRDQGQKLPLRTKFHANRRGVGATAVLVEQFSRISVIRFFLYFLIRLKLFWCLRYAQRSHFASLVCPYNFPYKFGSCPYKNDVWKFKNLYLLKEFFDRFGVFGKVVGMDTDYTGKNNTR